MMQARKDHLLFEKNTWIIKLIHKNWGPLHLRHNVLNDEKNGLTVMTEDN